ncbi:MAG: hypothetical protein ACRDTT_14805 [Pseudonocardiaceae bacterium]
MRTANIQKKPPRIMLVAAVVPRMMVTSPPDGFGVGGNGGKAARLGVGGSAGWGRFPLTT